MRTKVMTTRARRLRRNTTDVEHKLWRALRRDQLGGLHFRRQHPIGPYTLDFYCPTVRLAIEVDGGQHALRVTGDARRTLWLNARGIYVLRFWNNEVSENLEGVLGEVARIAKARLELRSVGSRPPPGERMLADLPLSGGGERSSDFDIVFGEVDR